MKIFKTNEGFDIGYIQQDTFETDGGEKIVAELRSLGEDCFWRVITSWGIVWESEHFPTWIGMIDPGFSFYCLWDQSIDILGVTEVVDLSGKIIWSFEE